MSRYKDKIKVIGVDMLCFPACPDTLEPLGVSCCDPHAWRLPEDEKDRMHINEWNRRRNE